MQRNVHTIDATGKILGRLASEISILLRGKHKITFQPHKDEGDIVNIKNVKDIAVTGKKMDDKTYYRHSGYPGGIKEIKLKDLMAKKPSEALRKAVFNMLPKNKLRSEMIKRLRFVK